MYTCLEQAASQFDGRGILIVNSRSPAEEKDQTRIAHSAVLDVFGDSDEEEEEERTGYAHRNDMEHDSNVSMKFRRLYT